MAVAAGTLGLGVGVGVPTAVGPGVGVGGAGAEVVGVGVVIGPAGAVGRAGVPLGVARRDGDGEGVTRGGSTVTVWVRTLALKTCVTTFVAGTAGGRLGGGGGPVCTGAVVWPASLVRCWRRSPVGCPAACSRMPTSSATQAAAAETTANLV